MYLDNHILQPESDAQTSAQTHWSKKNYGTSICIVHPLTDFLNYGYFNAQKGGNGIFGEKV